MTTPPPPPGNDGPFDPTGSSPYPSGPPSEGDPTGRPTQPSAPEPGAPEPSAPEPGAPGPSGQGSSAYGPPPSAPPYGSAPQGPGAPGPAPYGTGAYDAPPGAGYGHPAVRPGNDTPKILAMVSMGTGIAGLVICCCWGIPLLPIVALVTGFIARNDTKTSRRTDLKTFITVGLVTGVLGLLASIAYWAWVVIAGANGFYSTNGY